MPRVTPIQQVDNRIWFKRDDLYRQAGIGGGKVRACWGIATREPYNGLITASARESPQAQIVARLAQQLGIPARLHMPTGKITREMEDVKKHGGTIIQHQYGYNSVIISKAIADHQSHPGWCYIPFGMEHADAVASTATQVTRIPDGVQRIVIAIGSGMSAAGVLTGLVEKGFTLPVLGIQVGADPTKRLNNFAPPNWRELLTIQDITYRVKYQKPVNARLFGVTLDPYYEAKCSEYIQPGDLFWIIGKRATATS